MCIRDRGIGMLVDNSIVVIENIYRLRGKGVSAARAAVMGANQVAGAIFASTLTTICVFLPIIFTDGITRQTMQDMCLTIAYSLSASLIVALTVVPTMGATLLRKEPNRKHRFFHACLLYTSGEDHILLLLQTKHHLGVRYQYAAESEVLNLLLRYCNVRQVRY